MERIRPRVLLIAEACNPAWTSVPLLAFYWFRALRKHADLTLVTQVRNRAGFEEFLQPHEVAQITFINSESLAAPLHKLARFVTRGHPTSLGLRNALLWPVYVHFENLIWKRFGRSVLRGEFDLVHRLTPLSPTFPSPIASRSGVPFIVGPLNGSLPWPPGTTGIRRQEGEWLTGFRRLHRVLPYWRKTFERANLILVAAEHVQRNLPYRARLRSVLLPENGVDVERFIPPSPDTSGGESAFNLLFVGRLIPLKQPTLLVEVVKQLKQMDLNIRAVYLGDGPERDAIIGLARLLEVEDHIELSGHVRHELLVQHYQNAFVLVLPSVHESGGAVLLEAMACGLPCIAIDYGGPSEYVTPDVGIKIPLGPRPQMVADFTDACARLLKDPLLRARMRKMARKRAVSVYSWSAKAAKLVSLYNAILYEREISGNAKLGH